MIPNLTGEWRFHGHPWDAPHEGLIGITLTQNGTALQGELITIISPFTGQPPDDVEITRAKVEGEIILDPTGINHLVLIKRINFHDQFRAIFAGVWNNEEQTITGTFRNNIPGGGTFVILHV
jgi:hypothetical protein